MIEFVIQTLPPINFTTKPTLTSDPHSSVHGYAQEHTSIYIYIHRVCTYIYIYLKLIGRKVGIANSITHADEMWVRSSKLALSRRTLHYPRVDLDQHWNECVHDRPSWHYLGLPFTIQKWVWVNIGKVDILQSGIGPILAKLCLIEGGFGPQLNKVATIGSGFGPKLGKVETSGLQNRAKWLPSGPNVDQN